MKADRLNTGSLRCRMGWHRWHLMTTGMRGGAMALRWYRCLRCNRERMRKGNP